MQELAQMKLELKEAVQGERFEKAAELRDQIRKLEQDMMDPRLRPRG